MGSLGALPSCGWLRGGPRLRPARSTELVLTVGQCGCAFAEASRGAGRWGDELIGAPHGAGTCDVLGRASCRALHFSITISVLEVEWLGRKARAFDTLAPTAKSQTPPPTFQNPAEEGFCPRAPPPMRRDARFPPALSVLGATSRVKLRQHDGVIFRHRNSYSRVLS